MLVDNTNQQLHSKIQLLELIDPQDPNYTVPITQANTTTSSHLASKLNKGLTARQRQTLDELQATVAQIFNSGTSSITMAGTEQLAAGKIAQLVSRDQNQQRSPGVPGFVVSTGNAAGVPIFTGSQ